jgi:hypothetical protein
VLLEAWGGDTPSAEISATKKQGIDDPNAKVFPPVLGTQLIEAASALRNAPSDPNPRYAWFDGSKPRFGVLVELGRVAVELGSDSARKLADMLAQDLANGLNPTTREVERWLRHERLKARGRK